MKINLHVQALAEIVRSSDANGKNSEGSHLRAIADLNAQDDLSLPCLHMS